ncbi:ferredoxin reductase [Rhodococcus sp. X156]|uniref:ferredoxin reductase n=1 Tax=Rhodococcus sp. X156 TaxID=2499145 RepID=UPI0013E33411|nr:ferredoxin reductase [Rhodococcus sp. X156]
MPTPANPRPGLLAKVGVPLLERLATPHSPDRYLEMINPTWSLREVRGVVTSVHRSAPESITLQVQPNSNWRGFQAGQHVVFTLIIAGVRRSRCYSVTSSEHHRDGLLEFTVRKGPDGLVSGFLHSDLAPGTVVHITQAQGDFVLPSPRPAQVLLVSGGSGITPVMSMLRTLCDEGYTGRVTFLHYTRRAEDVPYDDELTRLAAEHDNVQLLRVCTQEDNDRDGITGRFSADQLEQHVPGWRQATSYVCGSARLVEDVRALWAEHDLEHLLKAEQFDPPAAIVPTDGEITGTVSFSKSGKSADNTGRPLLEQAEALGLTPEYGCRMGICFSCTRRKTAGNVQHLHTGEVTTESEADIQLCVTVPVGGDVTVDL